MNSYLAAETFRFFVTNLRNRQLLRAITPRLKAPTLGESEHFESQFTSLRIDQRLLKYTPL